MSNTNTAANKSSNQSVAQNDSLLNQAILATKQTDSTQVEKLLKTLTNKALDGTVTWDKSLVQTIENAIQKLDQTISKQLASVMHHNEFKKLEGSWRGLNYLTKNTSTSGSLKIRMLNANKHELYREMDKAPDYDQSVLFKKIYDNEFGMPGGEPYSMLIGDYQFTSKYEDMNLLNKISGVAAASFCPFISAADSQIMGLSSWSELSNPRDLEKMFESAEFAKWRSFRETDDSRFVTLTMPRVLARMPYGRDTLQAEGFDYEETGSESKATSKMDHNDYCWMNAAYVLGSRITNAVTKYGWPTAIRGAEGGGKVENLPMHTFKTDDGDVDAQCPTEIGITDRRENELSKLGFMPLSHYKNTDYAVFFGGQTVQKPKKYNTANATANAEISARLPYILATSRFAHYLKVMARDKIGSFMEVEDCEVWLNNWINTYVNANAGTNPSMKAQYPLAEANVEVKEVPGKPGAYQAVAHLRPWLQFEELTTTLSLVAQIPKLSK